MSLVDTLNQLWNTILDITKMFVIPDWSAVIGLLPLLIFIGIVGPLITFVVLGIVVYQAAKPRPHLKLAEGPQVARIGATGQPIFQPGLPFCRQHGLVYSDRHHPLRTGRRGPVGDLPDVRARPPRRYRYLPQLWARPQRQVARRSRSSDRAVRSPAAPR